MTGRVGVLELNGVQRGLDAHFTAETVAAWR